MSRTSPNSAPSTPTSTSLVLRIAALALAGLLAASCSSAASGHSSHDGTITGSIRRGGGPGAMPRPPVAGTVTVFNSNGKAVAHTTVRNGQQFHFTLPPGHYRINSGTQIFDPRNGCTSGSAVLRPSASIHVDVASGCAIP